jgi:hypothetical protein
LLKAPGAFAETFRVRYHGQWALSPLVTRPTAELSAPTRIGFKRRWVARIPRGRPERVALVGLVAILALGALLRVLFMLAWGPAFMGFPDASAYVAMASGSLWADPTHEVGYALFLRDLHAISGHLWFTILAQHAFGLASGVLWWLIMRRAGGRPWLALVPVAVVALNGAEMFLEHSTLSESLFILLLSAALYFAVRSLDAAGPRWAALAGLTLALACIVRVVALPLVGVLLLWLVLVSAETFRRRAWHAALAGGCVVAVLGSYAAIQHHETGYWGLTTPAGAWNLYTRVAPFADCRKFTPPPGTAVLCERTPPAQRTSSVSDYAYSPTLSPAVKAFSWGDGPYSAGPDENRKLASFTRAVILHQPGDYAKTFLEGMLAYVAPTRVEFRNRAELGPDYQAFFHQLLFDPTTLSISAKTRLPYYGARSFTENRSLLQFLLGYEAHSRVTGALMATLMLLSLLGLFAPAGRPRKVALLMFLIAWAALITPPATHWWDSRYIIPALGPLAAAATFGAWQLSRLTGHRWRRIKGGPRTQAPSRRADSNR